MERTRNSGSPVLRPHLWVGLALLLLGHFLIFATDSRGQHVRPYSDYWFAAIWFGYIFTLDALVYARDGRSLFVSRRDVFLAMLPLSAAAWWAFEALNEIVQNWHYLRPYDIPEWYANALSWLFFSTVIPAVWETADWLGGTKLLLSMRRMRGFRVPDFVVWLLVALGIASFLLPLFMPHYFFPLIWGFAALILDPINFKRGLPSILGHWSKGEWRVPLAFYLGGLVCGVFWEFWNFWAFPKWYYTVPYVGFLKVFEMPLMGYLGYGPFAWELFALFWFVAGFIKRRPAVDSLTFPSAAASN